MARPKREDHVDASGPAVTPEENNAAMASGIDPPADEADTADGQRVAIAPERTGAVIAAEWLDAHVEEQDIMSAAKRAAEAVALRRLALEDEIGRRMLANGATRGTFNMGNGNTYRLHRDKATKTYSFVLDNPKEVL